MRSPPSGENRAQIILNLSTKHHRPALNVSKPCAASVYGLNHESEMAWLHTVSYAQISRRHQMLWTSITQPLHDIYSHWCVRSVAFALELGTVLSTETQRYRSYPKKIQRWVFQDSFSFLKGMAVQINPFDHFSGFVLVVLLPSGLFLTIHIKHHHYEWANTNTSAPCLACVPNLKTMMHSLAGEPNEGLHGFAAPVRGFCCI